MTAAASRLQTPSEITLAYHARTKHNLNRYAAGPETLDWDLQPNPFREFEGSPRSQLLLAATGLDASFADLHTPGAIEPAAPSLESLSMLLELSFGLSAWKEYGPDRWALRCNPSSGNLHPTEAYVLTSGTPGLDDGLYHYVSRDHALELRCLNVSPAPEPKPARLWIGLSSIHWREAWKYGERGFRYCQLDIGHAIGALRYAAAALGWTAKVLDGLTSAELAALMGLDRTEDFSGVEWEDPDILVAIDTGAAADAFEPPVLWEPNAAQWAGRANLLDPHPMYHWPVIHQVSQATRGSAEAGTFEPADYPSLEPSSDKKAADLILGRRSAQRFDNKFVMGAGAFVHIADSLLARPTAPFDIWDQPPHLHPIFYVHRVEGLEPGAYVLPRSKSAEQGLRESLDPDFLWLSVEAVPDHLPLFRLVAGDCRNVARTASCHQFIASDSCFALTMLAEFDAPVGANPWHYRQLHWEAGLLGQVLYLEAEAAGLRGTGIGCFFDDTIHELLGLKAERFQALYNFTIGRAITDDRITNLPAYPGRQPAHKEE